jgi:hypothetical protein
VSRELASIRWYLDPALRNACVKHEVAQVGEMGQWGKHVHNIMTGYIRLYSDSGC